MDEKRRDLNSRVAYMEGQIITFREILHSMGDKLSSLETLDKFDAEERMAKRIAEKCIDYFDSKSSSSKS